MKVNNIIISRSVEAINKHPNLSMDETFDLMVRSINEPYDEALALQWYQEVPNHAELIKLLSRPDMAEDVQKMIKQNPTYDEIIVLYQMIWYLGFETIWDSLQSNS